MSTQLSYNELLQYATKLEKELKRFLDQAKTCPPSDQKKKLTLILRRNLDTAKSLIETLSPSKKAG